MKLSDVHIALMEHCIGLDNHKPYRRHGKLFFKPKRNYFDCGPANLEVWDEIVALGLAIDWDGKGWYKLTKTGSIFTTKKLLLCRLFPRGCT